MPMRSKPVALFAVMTSLVAAAAWGQAPVAAPRVANRPAAAPETIVVPGYLDVIDRSDVSALREGVLEKLEVHVGLDVKKDAHLGWLHKKTAELNATKARLVARNEGEMAKAQAQLLLAMKALARSKRLNEKFPGAVSQDELEKQEAEVLVGKAMVTVAGENREINKAEHDIAEQIVQEHEILTPISGTVTEILKRPGESVRANEAVARIVNIDKLRFIGYVPIEATQRLKLGDVVQVRPNVEGTDVDIERMNFPAKVTFIAKEVQVVGKTEVLIYAELANDKHVLSSGLKAEMTVTFGPPVNTVGSR